MTTNVTNHLANERTFLAWIRTNLGIMAFGLVIGKFSFFVQQIGLFLRKSEPLESTLTYSNAQGYSSLFGASLVGVGAILCLFAFIKFKKTQKQINEDIYQPSTSLDVLLTLFIFGIGVFLIIYLIA